MTISHKQYEEFYRLYKAMNNATAGKDYKKALFAFHAYSRALHDLENENG